MTLENFHLEKGILKGGLIRWQYQGGRIEASDFYYSYVAWLEGNKLLYGTFNKGGLVERIVEVSTGMAAVYLSGTPYNSLRSDGERIRTLERKLKEAIDKSGVSFSQTVAKGIRSANLTLNEIETWKNFVLF